jgi:septum formation protein
LLKFSKKIYLASRSPRRAELLKKIGINFEIKSCDIDENIYKDLAPEKHVKILSFLKAAALSEKIKNGIILGADTIVVLDKRILGKPKDKKEAMKMLQLLSNKIHKVYTGFTLIDMPSQRMISEFEMTKVKFRRVSKKEINEYVESEQPLDKAGAYGIQDNFGSVFVESIEGCYYNVVGFPLSKFYLTAKDFIKK